MAANESPHWSKFLKLVLYSITVVYAATTITFIAIYRNSEWHPHLVKFMARVWATFVSYNAGSTSPGFLSSILLSLLGIVIVALYIGYFKGFAAMKEHVSETAALAVIGIVTVVLLVYGTQFAWEVAKVGYKDHTTLAAKVSSLESGQSHMVDPSGRDYTIASLQNQLRETQSQLAIRKQMVVVGDPAFDNTRKILEAFREYRSILKGKRCYVYITSPSQSEMVTMISELSNSESDCFTSSSSGQEDPDAEAEVKSGMVPGVVLIHAPKGDVGADRIEQILGGTLSLKRSYIMPSITFPHYADQTTNDSVLWLQFGPDVHWTSDRSGKVSHET